MTTSIDFHRQLSIVTHRRPSSPIETTNDITNTTQELSSTATHQQQRLLSLSLIQLRSRTTLLHLLYSHREPTTSRYIVTSTSSSSVISTNEQAIPAPILLYEYCIYFTIDNEFIIYIFVTNTPIFIYFFRRLRQHPHGLLRTVSRTPIR